MKNLNITIIEKLFKYSFLTAITFSLICVIYTLITKDANTFSFNL